MQLSSTAEYALRAMSQLALLPPGEGLRSQDLADAAGIPSHYVSKILRKLVLAGLLHSRKGHGGGFELARPAARIRFIDIFEAVDALPDERRCAFGWGQCNARSPCPLHTVYSRYVTAWREWAERSTLAEIEDRPRRRG